MMHIAKSAAVLCAAMITTAAYASARALAEKPDIVLIFTDDLRADSLGCEGNARVRTPHIDRLAERGVRFGNAYLAGADSGALCMPSRAMLMTGRHYSRIGHRQGWTLEPRPMLPEWLRLNGYTTHMTGKWHNGAASLVRAFPDARCVLNSGMGNHVRKNVIDVRNGETTPPYRIPKHSTDAFTDAALSFITAAPADQPMFLYLAFSAPHDPRQPVSPWREHHEADLPPLPPNFLPEHPFNLGEMLVRDEHLAPWPRPESMIREQTAHYLAMVEHIDDSVGRVIEALEAAGRLDRSLIIFTSDNGLAMGSHGLLGKQSAYEHSLRIPMIVAGPGIRQGAVDDRFVVLHDLTPTLLEIAGAPVPDGIDGRSLALVLVGGDAVPPRERLSLSVHFGDLEIHALREGPWKLIRYPYLDKTQLFHLGDDPHETRDLATQPEHGERVAAMLAALAAELAENGPDRPLFTDRRIPATLDFSKVTQSMDHYQPAWIRDRYQASP